MTMLVLIVIGAIAALVGLNARRWIDAVFDLAETFWRDV